MPHVTIQTNITIDYKVSAIVIEKEAGSITVAPDSTNSLVNESITAVALRWSTEVEATSCGSGKKAGNTACNARARGTIISWFGTSFSIQTFAPARLNSRIVSFKAARHFGVLH